MMIRCTKSHAALLAAAVALASVAVPAAAQQDEGTPSSGVFKTAKQVNELCNSTDDAEIEECDYFLMAAHDMMKFYGDTGTGGLKICLPTGTTALQVRTTVLDYWRGRPESLRFSAVSTVYNALSERYGCES